MDKKKIDELMKKRNKLIASLMKSTQSQIQENQKKVLENILEKFVDKLDKDEDGNVLNNHKNRILLNSIDEVFKDYQKKEANNLVLNILNSVLSIVQFNKEYFVALDGKARVLPLIPKVNDFMKGWLGVKGDVVEPNGYIDQLIKSDSAKIAVKNLGMKIVIGQEGFENAKAQVKELIDGNPEKLGAFEKHHRNFAFDLYSQIDRATSDVVRSDLGFEFAIYEGGLIETSRIFCVKHEGLIYHISEIKKFDPKVGIPPNYNPITDLGGYGCRHHLNWISNAMAKALRPDAVYFINGTAEKEGIKPPEHSDEKIKEERKRRFGK